MMRQKKNTGRHPAGTRVKDYLLSHKRQMAQMLLVMLFCGCMVGQQVYAASPTVDSITSGMNSLKSFVKTIVIAIGIIIATFGGVTLGLGFAQDNPDGQSRGIKFLVGGLVIAAVGAIIALFS